ncbi:uncharacterized protein N0V89_003644 [Didymosphaeria variabile]|uniref:Mid2 domain-containing protein n=1 Tax=Didymosphaeria variabile TaxID=1932322 RepID=A0A9W8XNF3_9PLEO|nr:uncharacterized protein N0V89_003644 [Didymosphaeria variabile]KAJ4355624.1 hypothetical protein N0V89_003644 [Didymosphaeria variabile]
MPETTMITAKASIEAFNRGPITKYWEPAPSCSNTMSKDANMYYGWGASGVIDTACYPMGTLKYNDIKPASAWDLYYYSPAICPKEWTVATTYSDNIPKNDALTSLSVGTSTTAVLCCPSGFSYYTQGHVCTSTIKEDQTLKYVVPGNDEFGTLSIGPVSTSIYSAGASHAFANGIVVMFQSSDTAMLRSVTVNPTAGVASTSATTTTPSAQSSTGTTNTAVSTGAATSTGDAQPVSSSGLSTGAKVGMGVGIPCALLLGLLFGWFLFRKRRTGNPYPPGYDETGMVKYAQVHEAHTEPPEIGGNPRLDTLPTDVKVAAAQVHQRHELQ